MDDLEKQRQLRLERDSRANDTPNCPKCLTRMLPTEGNREPVWQRPECGAIVPA